MWMWVAAAGLVLALGQESRRLGEEVELLTKWARNELQQSEVEPHLSALPASPVLFISSPSASTLVLTLLPSTLPADPSYRYASAGWQQGKWTLGLEALTVGRETVAEEPRDIRLDWDRDGVWGPEETVKSLYRRIARNRRCAESGDSLLCDCGPLMPKTMYPTLYFRLAAVTVELAPEFYMRRNGTDQCMVTIWPEKVSYWSFGLPFFRQYSTALSPKSMTIGLAPRSEGSLGWTAIVGTAVGLVIAAGVGKQWRGSRKQGLLLEYDYLGLRIR